jgi:predicted Fe-Mo cluster-binding NifX family protein
MLELKTAAVGELMKSGIEVIITDRVGANVKQAFDATGIKIVLDFGGTVREIVEKYLKLSRD